MNIAIIPARSGSKRIKNKNIKNFCGKPIIDYVIQNAYKSGIFSEIFVSTDDFKIVNKVKVNNPNIKFIMRPRNVSNDRATTIDAIKFSIKSLLDNENYKFSNVCCIYPCSVLSTIKDLKDTYKILLKNNKSFVFIASEFRHPVERAFYLDSKQNTNFFFKNMVNKRTQDLKKSYFDLGQFYWGSVESWLTKKEIHNSAKVKVVDSNNYVDIDYPDDWRQAEIIYRMRNKVI